MIVVEALVSEAEVVLAEEAAQLKYMGASANTISEFSEVDEDTISEISEVDEDIVLIKREMAAKFPLSEKTSYEIVLDVKIKKEMAAKFLSVRKSLLN